MEKKIVTMRINGDLILGSEKGILDCANSGGTISLNSPKQNTTIEHSFDFLVLGGDIRINGAVYIKNLEIPANVCASIICNRIIISKTKQIEKVDINTVWDVSSNGVYHFNALSAFGISQSPNYVETKTPPIDKPLLLKYGDGGIDDMELGYYTGLHYLNKNGQEVDMHVIEWMEI